MGLTHPQFSTNHKTKYKHSMTLHICSSCCWDLGCHLQNVYSNGEKNQFRNLWELPNPLEDLLRRMLLHCSDP